MMKKIILSGLFLSVVACGKGSIDNGDLPEIPLGPESPDSPGTLTEYPVPDRSTILAFPGAAGAGRYVSGGAGGLYIQSLHLPTTGRKAPSVGLSKRKVRVPLYLRLAVSLNCNRP